MYSTAILSNTATIREENSTEIEFLLKNRETHRITRHYSAEQQIAKQTRTSKNLIEFTYSNFPCHLKVDRDYLALINRLWKCKKGERLTITANSFTKIDQLDDSARCSGPYEKIPPSPGTNQIPGFVEFRPFRS